MPKRSAQEHSPLGSEVFADDELLETFAGGAPDVNVLYVDQWGVWVCGLAPVRDPQRRGSRGRRGRRAAGRRQRRRDGRPAQRRGASLRLDVPDRRGAAQPHRARRDHRRSHGPLQPPLPARASVGGDRARPRRQPAALAAVLRPRPVQGVQRPATATARATTRCAVSPASSTAASGTSTWRRATAARSSRSSCWAATPTPPPRWPSACGARSRRSQRSSARTPTSRSASVWPRSRPTPASRRSCSTRPTGPCTWPSAEAATGSSPSPPASRGRRRVRGRALATARPSWAALADAVDGKQQAAGTRSRDVARIAALVAAELGFDDDECPARRRSGATQRHRRDRRARRRAEQARRAHGRRVAPDPRAPGRR